MFNCAARRKTLLCESRTVNTSPDRPARTHTAIQLPAVLLVLNESDVLFVDPASLLAVCINVTLLARASQKGKDNATASTSENSDKRLSV